MDKNDALDLCEECDTAFAVWNNDESEPHPAQVMGNYLCNLAPRLAAAVRELVREREEMRVALEEARDVMVLEYSQQVFATNMPKVQAALAKGQVQT